MSRRNKLMLVIFLFVMCLTYCGIYAVVTSILMPADLNYAKSGINMTPQHLQNEKDIKELENQAILMEKYSLLKTISPSQRVNEANRMRNNTMAPETPEILKENQEFSNFNKYRTWAYALIFRWDISNELQIILNKMEEFDRLNNETESINQKMATDWENGDNEAYVSDLKELANKLKEYDELNTELETHFQNLKTQLEK